MAIQTLWNPFSDAISVRRAVDRMLNDAFVRPGTLSAGNGFAVPFDLFGEGDEFVFRAALPGINPEQVEVSVDDGVLTVAGTRRLDGDSNGRTWYFRGLPQGSFRISTALPAEVDADGAQASYEQGVLSVRLPKSEYAKTKRIQVTTAAPHPVASGE